jgi:phenylacetate-coenzyme A ligase PaaK-like adenylate-forming protein
VSDERTGLDQLVVNVEPREDIVSSEWASIQKKVKDALYLHFMLNMDVIVVPPKSLPITDFKAKRFHDLRKSKYADEPKKG